MERMRQQRAVQSSVGGSGGDSAQIERKVWKSSDGHVASCREPHDSQDIDTDLHDQGDRSEIIVAELDAVVGDVMESENTRSSLEAHVAELDHECRSLRQAFKQQSQDMLLLGATAQLEQAKTFQEIAQALNGCSSYHDPDLESIELLDVDSHMSGLDESTSVPDEEHYGVSFEDAPHLATIPSASLNQEPDGNTSSPHEEAHSISIPRDPEDCVTTATDIEALHCSAPSQELRKWQLESSHLKAVSADAREAVKQDLRNLSGESSGNAKDIASTLACNVDRMCQVLERMGTAFEVVAEENVHMQNAMSIIGGDVSQATLALESVPVSTPAVESDTNFHTCLAHVKHARSTVGAQINGVINRHLQHLTKRQPHQHSFVASFREQVQDMNARNMHVVELGVSSWPSERLRRHSAPSSSYSMDFGKKEHGGEYSTHRGRRAQISKLRQQHASHNRSVQSPSPSLPASVEATAPMFRQKKSRGHARADTPVLSSPTPHLESLYAAAVAPPPPLSQKPAPQPRWRSFEGFSSKQDIPPMRSPSPCQRPSSRASIEAVNVDFYDCVRGVHIHDPYSGFGSS
jgi:hypothetical protein